MGDRPDSNDARARLIRQACAIPFRRQAQGAVFCLITSLKRKRWIFPKGIIEHGESPERTALKEAFEEAGLHGQIVGGPLGTYQDAKWGAILEVVVLLMEVHDCENEWPESDLRERCWAAADEAIALVAKNALKQMLKRATASV